MAIIPTDPVLPATAVTTSPTAVGTVATPTAIALPVAVGESLQIQTTQILPTQAPDLKVGDLIQFLVKNVKPNNTGLLYFFGQLIEAKIPPGLKNGDIIRAEVQKQNNSVVLKIKEILATTDTSTSPPDAGFIIETDSNLTQLLSHKVEFILKTLDTVLNKNKIFTAPSSESPKLVPFPTIPTIDIEAESPATNNNVVLRGLEKSLLILQKLIPKDALLSDSKKVKEVLQNIQSGSLVEDLHENLLELTATLDKSSVSHEGRFLIELVKRLYPLKDLLLNTPSEESTGTINQELNKLLLVLGREIENANSTLNTQTPSKLNFRATLQQVKLALENLQNLDNKEEQGGSLESVIKQTEAQIKSSFPTYLQSKEDIINTTKKMLGNLESLIQSQDMLNRLEPILQTLKEPQLLLFPFLLTGMFGFGELVVDPDGHRHSKGGKNNNSRNKTKQTFAYQGVIPLPNLGQVQFNAIQTESEIELTFTLEDEEKRKFFEGELSDLRAELLSAGITTNSISLSTAIIRKPMVEGLEMEDPLVVL